VLYLPPNVVAERNAEENKRFFADLTRNVTANDPVAQECTAKLKQMHPDLWMVRAHDTIDADLPLRPGFYHLLRLNDPAVAPVSVFDIHDDGRWCEPSIDRVIDRLNQGNLTQRRVRDRLMETDRVVRRAVEKEHRTVNEDRRAELRERVNAAVRAQVSMDRTIPWTQSSDGRRGAKT
jgi:hypothetical protein